MIEVENLTKQYYDVVAIDSISFQVGKGQVVGFLGPNGAGKSTTLKILTCFLPATSGTARVADLDVFQESMKVREQVGYLPENVPLYGDMRVTEYLQFRGHLKGLHGSKLKSRIGEVCEICGLADMKRRIVGQLSKGYKQRVGLADVLINRPPILLLDEPTGGLDPSQRREVRDLISNLGRDHTILLSSHILGEVETVCNRVIIIKKGRIIADGETKNLVQDLKGGERLRIACSSSEEDLRSALARFPGGVKEIAFEAMPKSSRITVEPMNEEGFQERLLRHLVTEGVAVTEFFAERFTLEEIFIRLTVEDEVLSSIKAEGEEEG